MLELFTLLKDFFNKNKKLVISSITVQIIYSILETILLPYILSGAFNNIDKTDVFLQQLIKLVCLWLIIKTVRCISLHYHSQIEPVISKFIITSVIKSVFYKF